MDKLMEIKKTKDNSEDRYAIFINLFYNTHTYSKEDMLKEEIC
jgi:hypothetical protein